MKNFLMLSFIVLSVFSGKLFAAYGEIDRVVMKEDWRTCPLRITIVGDTNTYAVQKSNLMFNQILSMVLSAKMSGKTVHMWIPLDNGATSDACLDAGEQVKEATTFSIY